MLDKTSGGFSQTDNAGAPITIPIAAIDDFAYFKLEDDKEIRKYYADNGYVVVRGLVPDHLCDRANSAFYAEVKPSKRYIYRQATQNPERNVFTPHGYVLNSILNIQSLDPRHYGAFRDSGVKVFTHERMQRAVRLILGEDGKLVQSMYFEGNPSTWPHQDTYYLDAETIGSMVGAWIATEDIEPGAGRFFVYPKSHLINMQKNGGDFDVAFNHDRYKRLILDTIAQLALECRAPALSKGDVLFWNSKTIHGSLPTTQTEFSRRSFTAHFIPSSQRFLQFQSRIKALAFEIVGGLKLARPKDQARLDNRAVLFVETTFPTLFRTLKKAAIKLAVTR